MLLTLGAILLDDSLDGFRWLLGRYVSFISDQRITVSLSQAALRSIYVASCLNNHVDNDIYKLRRGVCLDIHDAYLCCH